jgi:hypothetical protein
MKVLSGETIDAILIAYNNACAEMRSEARDAYMWSCIDHLSES